MSMSRIATTRLLSLAVTAAFLFVLQRFAVPYLERLGGFDNRLIVLCSLFGTLAVSLNLINGITGQFSIGHAAFYMIGAYATGYFTVQYHRPGQTHDLLWLLAMICVGAVAAGIAGFVVGMPSLRLRGDYLAVVTLGFGEIVQVIVRNVDALGGSYGFSIAHNYAPVKITPVWLVVLLFIVSVAVCRNVLKTAHGLAFLAVREDELAASAMGVNTTKTKVTAFVLGAALAGMAGALFAHYEGFITLKQFDMNQSFMILTMVVIGGTGSITGAAIAGVLLTLLPESLRDLPPVPGLTLFGCVIASVVVLGLLARFRSRLPYDRPGALRNSFAALGALGLATGLIFASLSFRQALPLTMKVCIALVGVGVACGLLFTRRRVQNLASFGLLVAVLGLILLLTKPGGLLLEAIPPASEALRNVEYEAGRLRFPFFAIMLVAVMLTRPQGLLGHHEFSWSWVKRLVGKRAPESAVAA